nr:hypothetical protein [Devosia faecipullorum]
MTFEDLVLRAADGEARSWHDLDEAGDAGAEGDGLGHVLVSVRAMSRHAAQLVAQEDVGHADLVQVGSEAWRGEMREAGSGPRSNICDGSDPMQVKKATKCGPGMVRVADGPDAHEDAPDDQQDNTMDTEMTLISVT